MADHPGYPKKFKQCPLCGEEEVLVAPLMEKEKTHWPEGFIGASQVMILPLRDPQRLKIMTAIPALVLSFDFCAKCGWQYIRRAEIRDMPIQMNIQDQHGKKVNLR